MSGIKNLAKNLPTCETNLDIDIDDIPDLCGKVVLISGGSSGIGLAAARIFAHKGARVTVLDIVPIDETWNIYEIPGGQHTPVHLKGGPMGSIAFKQCDVTDWASLRDAFSSFDHIDIAVANAGVSESPVFFEDLLDGDGNLEEPDMRAVDVNFVSTIKFAKLAISQFRRQPPGSSLVLTTSCLAYSPDYNLPVYSATKAGLVGLIRGLRPSAESYGMTVNGVAPGPTFSKMIPRHLAEMMVEAGFSPSSSYHVGLAIAYSAVATQLNAVERYSEFEGHYARLQDRAQGEWPAAFLQLQRMTLDQRQR